MTWTEILAPIKSTEYFTTLWEKVKNEYATTKVFPPKNQIFRALELTAFDDVEVYCRLGHELFIQNIKLVIQGHQAVTG